MKKLFLVIAFLSVFSNAQQVQWASKAIKFSSDLGGKQNGIKRILGKPDAFPQGGASANGWSPKNALGAQEYVVVGFDNPQAVKQVAIFENLNAGCAIRIQADSGDGKFRTVWAREIGRKTPIYAYTMPADRKYYYNRKRRKIQVAPDVDFNAGIENIILDEIAANVAAIRIDFNFGLLPGQKQIDAIAVSDSSDPVLAQINSTPELEDLAPAQNIDFGMEISNPVISADGKKLYFTTEGDDKELVFSCENNNGNWEKPKEEASALNDNEIYNLIEAANGDFILKGGVRYNRGTGESGFELLECKDGKYFSSGPIKITAYNNYDETAEAAITADAGILILGIETDFTQGGADLYFARRKDDGSYSLLENMGKTINSAAEESMPLLLPDDKTLLFSSNGFSGYGDYDIYVTTRLDDSWKKWSEPINLGSKINGPGFDGAPFYDAKTEMLYFIKTVGGKNLLCKIPIPMTVLSKN